MNIEKSKNLTKQDFVEIYKTNSNSLADNEIKQKAVDFIAKNELPNKKHENWRKTNITPLLKHNFRKAEQKKLSESEFKKYRLVGQKANIIVFFNGYFVPEFSTIIDSKDVFIMSDMATAKNKYPEYFNKYFNKTNPQNENVFSAMNTAFAENGAFLVIKNNSLVENPIHIYNIEDGNGNKTASLLRNLIIAEKGSKAQIIESHHTSTGDHVFTNAVTEIFTEANAHINFHTFQGEGDNSFQTNMTKVNQQTGSSFYQNIFTLCGKLVRNDLIVKIEGENCYTDASGFYMPDRNQHIDNSLYIDHQVGHSTSKQFYRGIIEDRASAVFSGISYINKNAIKTDIEQANNNILLSEHAKIHSKPQLIIYNDDVVATHGSTVGQLDKEALFYMRSRGIGTTRAKILLLTAFVEEVIEKVQIENLKRIYRFLIEKRLAGAKIERQCAEIEECLNCN